MGLDSSQAEDIFMLMDNGDGRISAEELCKGVSKLSGQAKSMDMNLVRKELRELQGVVSGQRSSPEVHMLPVASNNPGLAAMDVAGILGSSFTAVTPQAQSLPEEPTPRRACLI